MGICTINKCGKITEGNRKICSMHKSRMRFNGSYDLPQKRERFKNELMICLTHGELQEKDINFSKSKKLLSKKITQACKICAKISKKKRIKLPKNTISRTCVRCDEHKNKDDFHDFEWTKRSPWCISCKRINFKKISDIKQSRGQNTLYKRRDRLKTTFGITYEDYMLMLEKQKNVCAICHQPETMAVEGILKRLSVDHCHESEKNGIINIRGLLCARCNHGLGKFKDNIDTMNNAIQYLIDHPVINSVL